MPSARRRIRATLLTVPMGPAIAGRGVEDGPVSGSSESRPHSFRARSSRTALSSAGDDGMDMGKLIEGSSLQQRFASEGWPLPELFPVAVEVGESLARSRRSERVPHSPHSHHPARRDDVLGCVGCWSREMSGNPSSHHLIRNPPRKRVHLSDVRGTSPPSCSSSKARLPLPATRQKSSEMNKPATTFLTPILRTPLYPKVMWVTSGSLSPGPLHRCAPPDCRTS